MRFLFAAIALSIFSSSGFAQILDENLKITLETPQYEHHIGQIGQIRGWAFHPSQVVKYVEIYIDDELYSEVPVGGQRNDVYNAYPTGINSKYSGWAQTVNFKDFAEGYHKLEVVAYTNIGRFNSAVGKFCVEKVPGGNFISDPGNVINFQSLDMIHMAPNAVILQRITIDGEYYNMELHWDTATQGFIIEQVEPYVSKTYLHDTDHEGWCTLCKPPEGE